MVVHLAPTEPDAAAPQRVLEHIRRAHAAHRTPAARPALVPSTGDVRVNHIALAKGELAA